MSVDMHKSDYFLRAMRAECFRHKGWVIEAFSRVEHLNGEGKKWPYALTRQIDGSYTFVDPDNGLVTTLDETLMEGGPFHLMEDIMLQPGDLISVKEPTATCYGNVLLNLCCLIYAFGDKIPFQTGRLEVSKLENLIEKRLTSTPAPGEPRDPSRLYIDEFKRFNEGVRYLEGFSQLCVPSATVKTITVSPEVIKRRNELFIEHAHEIADPVVQAKIDRELIQMEKDWIKGDPAERFYIKGKSYDVVRKRLFLYQGQENGFGKVGEVITNSLSEGWNVEHLPAMANALRNGSYSRGFLTALGGVEAKGNYRIFQNTVVAEEDCGSKLGLRITLTPKIAKYFESFSVIEADGSLTELTDENLTSYIGRPLVIRSVAYCKTAGHNICAVCVGKKIAQTPTAISTYASDIGSLFLSLLLAQMHGVALKTSKINYIAMLR